MATLKQKIAFDKTLENNGIVSTSMLQAGYSPAMAKNPQILTNSKGWKELMDEHLSDAELARVHKELLKSSRLDHQVFSTGPRNEKERLEYIEMDKQKAIEKGREYEPVEYLTDDDIRQLFKDVNCQVKKIVHREMSRDVYFWSADNKARKDALDMAYKLKGSYAPEKKVSAHIDLTPTEETPVDAITREYEDKLLQSIINAGSRKAEHHSVDSSEQNQERKG